MLLLNFFLTYDIEYLIIPYLSEVLIFILSCSIFLVIQTSVSSNMGSFQLLFIEVFIRICFSGLCFRYFNYAYIVTLILAYILFGSVHFSYSFSSFCSFRCIVFIYLCSVCWTFFFLPAHIHSWVNFSLGYCASQVHYFNLVIFYNFIF